MKIINAFLGDSQKGIFLYVDISLQLSDSGLRCDIFADI